MDCPYCGEQLQAHDSFGKYLGNDRWDLKGDIFKCENEACEHAQDSPYFYTYRNNDNTLHEGYPC